MDLTKGRKGADRENSQTCDLLVWGRSARIKATWGTTMLDPLTCCSSWLLSGLLIRLFTLNWKATNPAAEAKNDCCYLPEAGTHWLRLQAFTL